MMTNKNTMNHQLLPNILDQETFDGNIRFQKAYFFRDSQPNQVFQKHTITHFNALVYKEAMGAN